MKTLLRMTLVLLLGVAVVRADQFGGTRFLFIVQASKDTKPQMTAVRSCLSNLFESRFSAGLHNDDSFGIWTYDNSLHAGSFPMQIWNGDEAEMITKKADDFLKKQSSSKEANLSVVFQPLSEVVKASESITVLIFTDGSQPMMGTPFDNAINRAFMEHRDTLRKTGVPFVTVLQAREGKIVRGLVNSAAAPPTIGPVPAVVKPTPVVTAAAAAAAVAAKPAAPPKILAPLVVDYSKVKPAVTSAPTAPPVRPPVSYPVAQLEPAPTKSAAPAPAASGGGSIWPLMFGAGLIAGLVVAVALWFFTRREPAPRRSVITESLERDKK